MLITFTLPVSEFWDGFEDNAKMNNLKTNTFMVGAASSSYATITQTVKRLRNVLIRVSGTLFGFYTHFDNVRQLIKKQD
jgi:hypothetical protein